MKKTRNERTKQKIAKRRTRKARERCSKYREFKYLQKEKDFEEKRILKRKIGRPSFNILQQIQKRANGSFFSALIRAFTRNKVKEYKEQG